MTPVQQALADQTNAELDAVVDRLVSFPAGADRDEALSSLEKCREAALRAIDATVDQAVEPAPAEAVPSSPEERAAAEAPPADQPADTQVSAHTEEPHADVAPWETAPSSPEIPETLHNEPNATPTQPGDEAAPTGEAALPANPEPAPGPADVVEQQGGN